MAEAPARTSSPPSPRTSRRGAVPGLASPVPLLHRLPGVLQDDDFTQRLVTAFDDAYAPVLTTLDSLACYVDPRLAPADFVDYLAGWVGIELDDSWSVEQRREIVAGAASVHRRRGTRRGIEEALSLALGAQVTVTDSGGCTWSVRPGVDLPGTSPARVEVLLEVADPDAVDPRRVASVLEATKPAHVAHTVDVVRRDEPAPAPPTEEAAAAAPPPPPPPPAPAVPPPAPAAPAAVRERDEEPEPEPTASSDAPETAETPVVGAGTDGAPGEGPDAAEPSGDDPQEEP